MSQKPRRVLYISWEGDAQNYMESLFLPLLATAQDEHVVFEVCLFSWASEEVRRGIEQTAQSLGIVCQTHAIIRKPPLVSLAGMVAFGAYTIVQTVKSRDIDAVFTRGSMPSLMVLTAHAKLSKYCKWLFDADGFSADERADFGYWNPQGPFYRIFRDVESQAARRAAGVMTRTQKAKTILLNRIGAGGDPDKIYVIPNGKDSTQFAPVNSERQAEVRQKEGVPEGVPWVLYVGSMGQQYYPKEMIELFEHIHQRHPTARFHILTGQQDVIARELREDHPAHQNISVTRVRPEEFAAYLSAADIGVSLRMPSYSQQGVCPIKNAEYLLCGLPVISTSGVGDMDEVFDQHDVGFICHELDAATFEQAANWVDDVMVNRAEYQARCRQAGLEYFDLEQCGRAINTMVREVL